MQSFACLIARIDAILLARAIRRHIFVKPACNQRELQWYNIAGTVQVGKSALMQQKAEMDAYDFFQLEQPNLPVNKHELQKFIRAGYNLIVDLFYKRHCVHGDIKPQKFCLFSDTDGVLRWYLVNFSYGLDLTRDGMHVREQLFRTTTIEYAPPELAGFFKLDLSYSFLFLAKDLFSFGLTVLSMRTKRYMCQFKDKNGGCHTVEKPCPNCFFGYKRTFCLCNLRTLQSEINKDIDLLFADYSDVTREILSQCLRIIPSERTRIRRCA